MATNNWWDNVWDTITDTVQGWLGGNDEPEQPAAPPVVTPQPNRPQQAAPSTTGQPLPVPAPIPTPTPTQSNRPQVDQAAIQEEQRREQERRRREQQQREQQERREQERLDRQEARNREAKSALEQQRKQERESQNKQAEDDPWTNLLDVIRGRKPIDQAPKARPVDGTEEPEEERVSGYQPIVGLQKPEVNTGAPQISATNVANQTVTAPEVVQEVRKEEPVSRVSPIAGPINSAMIPTDLTWQAAATLIDMWRNPDRYNQEEEEREDSAMMGPFPSARSLPDWYFNSGAYAQGEIAKQRGLESAENDPERFQQEIDENKRWRKELDENPHPLTYYPQAMYTDLRNAWLELRKAAPNTGDAIADAATWVRNNIGINLMDTPARVAATEPIRPGGSTPGVFMGVAQDLTTARVDAAYPKEDNIVSSVQRAASSAAQYPGMFTIAMLSHYAPWVFLEGDRPTAEKVGQNVQNVIDLTAEITRMEEGPEKEEAKLIIPAMIGGMDMMQRRDDLIRNRPRILEEMRKQAEVLLAQGNDRAAAAIGEEMRAIENYSLQDIIDITSDPAMEFLQGFAFDPLNFLDGPIGEVFDLVRIARINRGLTRGMRAGATVEENIPWLTRAIEEGKRIADEALANGGIIPDASTLPNASLTTRLRGGGAASKALSHVTGLFQATRGTEVARMTKSAYAALSEIVGVIPGITVQDTRTILRYLQNAPEQLMRGVPLQEFTTPAIHSTYRDTGLFQVGQNVLGSRGFMEAYPVIKLMGESLYENPYLSEALAAGDEIAQGLGVMNKEGFAAYFRSAFEDAASRMYGINSIQQMSTEIPFGTVGYRIRNATADESGGVPDVKIVEYLTENNQKLGQSGPMLGEAANKFVEDAKKIAAEPENGSLMRALQKPGNIERAIMNVTYLGLPRNWIRNGANAFAGALAEGGFNLMSKAEEVASMEKKLGGMFSDIRVAEAGEGQLARSMLGPEARGTGRRTPSADNSWERFSNWVLQFPYGNKGDRVPLGEQRWAVKIFNATFQKDFNRTIGPEIDNIIGQWLRSNGVSRKTTRKITDNLKEVARTGTKEEFMVAMRNNLLGGQSPLPLSAFGIPPGLISPEVESSIRGVVAEVAGGNTTPQQAADRVRALMRTQRQRAAEDVLRNSTSPGATNGISKDTIWDARDYENVMKSMGVPPAAANAAAQRFRDTQLQFVNTLLSDLSVGGTTPERVAIVRAVGSEVFWQQKQWRRQLDELNAHFKAGAAGLSNEMKQGWYAQQAQELSELDAEYIATINNIYQRAHRALSNDAEAAAFLADASSRGMIEDVIENYDPVTNAASRAKKYTSGRNADTKVNQEITNAWTQYVDVSMNKAWTALMSDPSPTALDDFLAADAKVRALKIATRERVDELWDIGRSQLIRDPKGGFDHSLQNRVNKLHQTSFEAQAAVWETAAEAIASRYIQSNRYVAPNGSTYQLLGVTPQGAIRVRKVEGTNIGRPISTTMGSETAPSEDELAKFARMQAIKDGRVPPPASQSVPSTGQASATATTEAVDISSLKPGDAFDVPSHGRVVYQRRITRNKTKASNDPNNVGRGPTYTYVVKKENGSEVQLTANQMASATRPPVSPADTPMPGQLWKSKRHGTVEILSETTNSKGDRMFNVRDVSGKELKVSAKSIGSYVGDMPGSPSAAPTASAAFNPWTLEPEEREYVEGPFGGERWFDRALWRKLNLQEVDRQRFIDELIAEGENPDDYAEVIAETMDASIRRTQGEMSHRDLLNAPVFGDGKYLSEAERVRLKDKYGDFPTFMLRAIQTGSVSGGIDVPVMDAGAAATWIKGRRYGGPPVRPLEGHPNNIGTEAQVAWDDARDWQFALNRRFEDIYGDASKADMASMGLDAKDNTEYYKALERIVDLPLITPYGTASVIGVYPRGVQSYPSVDLAFEGGLQLRHADLRKIPFVFIGNDYGNLSFANMENWSEATRVMNRETFARAITSMFDLDEEKSADLMRLTDARAKTWAKYYEGLTPEDWYHNTFGYLVDARREYANAEPALFAETDRFITKPQYGLRAFAYGGDSLARFTNEGTEDGTLYILVHELGHIFHEDMRNLARDYPEAAAQLRVIESWATDEAKRLAAAEAKGGRIGGSRIDNYRDNERMSEVVADGFIRYLRDEEVFSPEVASAFERMRQWFKDVLGYLFAGGREGDQPMPKHVVSAYRTYFSGPDVGIVPSKRYPEVLRRPDGVWTENKDWLKTGWNEPNRGDLWNAVSMRADTSDGRAAPEPGDMANNTLNDLDTAENTLVDAILSGRPFNEMQDGVIPAEIGQQMINHIAIMGQQWDNSVDFSRRTASDMMNRVMLDPEDRIGLDNIFRIISPYHYFWTRSAKNWAIRGIEHPWIANLYYERERDKEQQRQRNRIQNPEMPLRARDRMRIPGTDLYVSDMLDMYLPYNSFLGNEFVDPEQANNQFEKGLLFGKRHLPVFGPLMMAALSAGLDVTNPRAEGLPPRYQEFGLGDIAPQVRWAELPYQMATGKVAPWWISGDPYMYGIAGRSVATEPTPEGMDPRQAEAMRRWALDVGNQRQDGLEQLPEQPAGAIQQWERGVTESGGDKLMTQLMGQFLGPSFISVPPEELDARAVQAERRGAGYQGGENEFGSRAAIEAIDAESGQRHVSLAQYPDLYPQTYVSNPDDPDYGRPGFSASKLQRQIERDAASAEYKEQKDAFIEANLGVMPASEIKSAIYSKEEGIRAEYDKKRAAIDAKYPSADAGPDVELTQDYFLTMNPSELLEFAEERAVDAVNADATIFSMEQAMDAAADRKDWDTYYELKDEVATQKYNLLAEILMDKAAMGGFVAGLNVIVPGSEEAALKRAEELLTDTSYRSEWEEKLYAQGELERGEYNSDRTNGKQWVDEEGVQHSATGAQISKWWDEYNSQPDSAAKRQYLRDNPDFAAYYKQYRLERYGETEEYWTSTTGSTRRRMSGHPDFQRRNFGTSPYAGKFPTNTGGSGGGGQSRPATGGYNQYVADPYRISQASGGRVDLQPTQVQNPYQGANNPYATVRVDNPYDTVTPRQATVTNDWEQLLRQLTGN